MSPTSLSISDPYRQFRMQAALMPFPLKALVLRRPLSQYIPSSESLSTLEFQIKLLKAILLLCFSFIAALSLQYHVKNSAVPSKGYVVFVISIMFSFAGSFSALLITNNPKVVLLWRCYFVIAVVSMASALSILGYALFHEAFLWFYRELNRV